MYDGQDINLLIKKTNIIVNAVYKLIPTDLEIKDLKQYMILAGLRLIKRYNPNLAELNTYLEHRLRGAMHDFIIKHRKGMEVNKFDYFERTYEQDYIKEYTIKEIYCFISKYPENKALGLTLWLKGEANAKLISSILGVSQATFTTWKKQLIEDLKVYFKL